MSRFPTVIASLLTVACATAISGCVGWNTNPFSNQHLSAYPGSQQMLPSPPLAMGMPSGPPPDRSFAAPVSTPVTPALFTASPATTPATSQVPWNNPIRGQSPSRTDLFNAIVPGGQDHWRLPMQSSGQPIARGQNANSATPFSASEGYQGPYNEDQFLQPTLGFGQNTNGTILGVTNSPLPTLDFDVHVEEARTGRFMFGMGVNSDLGVTGQVVIEERNFDWLRLPRSWNDIIQGGAFRGGGQNFRLEAMPGTQVQRYLASFTHPYIYLPGFIDPFSLNLSGFLFDRRYFDWTESRLGGRVGLGYRLTHDLSLAASIRAENVEVDDLRVLGVPELDEVVGRNELYSGRVTMTHDTRDTPFAPTEGHLFEVSYEQVFGSFDYPRAEFDYRQYFLVRERPDGSGRHTLGYAFKGGFSGSQTPIFERYFAGGFSTMRGFDFRGASPVGASNVTVGGDFRFLGSVEYIFPLTADDMMRGVIFCDYGTVEQNIEINSDNYRVAPGAGLRISVPALGPAPLALDFAFPLAKAATDNTQVFSFFFGFGR